MARAPYIGLSVYPRADGRRVSADDIVQTVVAEIGSGKLLGGFRLPPVRALERQLGISKNTVQAAYDELTARGLVEARARDGIYVSSATDDTSIEPVLARSAVRPNLRPPLISLPAPSPPGAIQLSTVFIDPDLLPRRRIEDCVRSVLNSPGLAPYYDAQGYPPLRECIARRLTARGLSVDAEQVVLTTGSQQALDIVARCLAVRRIGVESPVYSNALRLFESLSCELVALPFDPFQPLPLFDWEKRIASRRPSACYVITSYQNPTGYCYSTQEMLTLLEIASETKTALIEDDWGSDMLSGSEYRPTLRALGGDNVIYINSFTKKLWPSLRVGYLVAPRDLVPALTAAKRVATLGNAWLSEAAVFEFLDRGYYEGHLGELQSALDARYSACLSSLRALMPSSVRWAHPGGGPTLWLEVPRSVDLHALRRGLWEQGVVVEATDDHFLEAPPHLHGFRIAYAQHAPERLRQGLEKLAAALQ